eukprot:3864888-Prymnesium_polylepis.2
MPLGEKASGSSPATSTGGINSVTLVPSGATVTCHAALSVNVRRTSAGQRKAIHTSTVPNWPRRILASPKSTKFDPMMMSSVPPAMGAARVHRHG